MFPGRCRDSTSRCLAGPGSQHASTPDGSGELEDAPLVSREQWPSTSLVVLPGKHAPCPGLEPPVCYSKAESQNLSMFTN